MEDKVITIVFGSLGATLALVSILFAYLQLRGFRPAVAPDEEQVVPLDVVAHGEPIPNPPTATVQEEPVTNPPYASCLPTWLYRRTDNRTDATPKTDMPSAIDCRRDSTDIATSWRLSKRMGLVWQRLEIKEAFGETVLHIIVLNGISILSKSQFPSVYYHLCFSSCSLKLQFDPNVAAAAAESDSAPGIGIVISHIYPAEVQYEEKKERTPRRCPKSYSEVLVSFFAWIQICGQPLSASGEMKCPAVFRSI
jgi:hypothetical protein